MEEIVLKKLSLSSTNNFSLKTYITNDRKKNSICQKMYMNDAKWFREFFLFFLRWSYQKSLEVFAPCVGLICKYGWQHFGNNPDLVCRKEDQEVLINLIPGSSKEKAISFLNNKDPYSYFTFSYKPFVVFLIKIWKQAETKLAN